MDSSVSPKDEIWFLRVCHHISNAVYRLLPYFINYFYINYPKIGAMSYDMNADNIIKYTVKNKSPRTKQAAEQDKFPAFYKNPKVHCRIHKRLPRVPILSQIKPVHVPIPNLKDQF